ncbi:M6 family metalloprotease domain protein [Kribbella flavida DSM 17836]|uniref:M6 family metalloprotease domain protein n=1 Tax=Kribbella flavida (strain DSM 17836 / JCM 10339 / NBRC 14399) TaxID=479435 RepID=D2Q2J0_KRIFD|nr:immune inhibitor A domain-containing protein [Kribbella flavida]ADB35886.1 M6 family metalloprotease domain protein [Kribbella flavida DSM 17836]
MRVPPVRTTAVGVLTAAVAIGISQLPAATAGPAATPPAAGTGAAGPTSTATVGEAPKAAGPGVAHADELPNPLEDKRRKLREQALNGVLGGSVTAVQRGPSKVVKVGQEVAVPTARDSAGRLKVAQHRKAQYVELAREKTDKIFVILAEFGNRRHPDYPDRDTDPNTPGPATYAGPVHNAIPAPDRRTDNSTVWQADYSAQHYRDLYFGSGESVKTYYEKQSSGRYSVDGTVSDWVKVPYNEARYGRSNGFPCAGAICQNTWALITDAVAQWVALQKKAGRTDAQIRSTLQGYDQWDRYDFDADGNFNEPDGYLDHFQIVHAGGDQADGDPHQGEDAIWSHRWYAHQNTRTGPPRNKLGGVQVGTTGLWIGDYTIQPENGGLSVFTHEYGHDLGLPDHYDTSGQPSQNPVNWWSVMAQSRAGQKGELGIGLKPQDLGTWDKLQLGWLDHVTVKAGQTRTVELGPHEYNSSKPQGLVVTLPKKRITTPLVAPAAGTKSWWSGSGDKLDNTLTRKVTLPAGKPALTFQANWKIEDCGPDACDYAYVEVNDGSGWKAIPGSITKAAEANGIDGDSGGWVPARFDLSAFAGKTVQVRFRYATDAATHGLGFFADEVRLTANGQSVVADGAEDGTGGWTAAGFRAAGSSVTTEHDHYYLASHYTYTSFNRYLQTGPYSFVGGTKPNWVEHFPYQDGLLVSYWDTSQSDNETAVHPGQGRWLPIDANPALRPNPAGGFWRSGLQSYDSTFGLQRSDSFDLTVKGSKHHFTGAEAVPLFDDRAEFWSAKVPSYGVKVPHVGVKIKVVAQHGTNVRVLVSR